MNTVKVGDVEIAALLDTPLLLEPDSFFPGRGEQIRAEYPDHLESRGLLQLAVTCYLLRSEGKNVLVDTGFGPRRKPGMPNGRLDQRLAEAGVAPAEIDVVLHTHLHVDHVGWNTVANEDGSRRIFFPNARHIVQQAEWDYWMRPELLADPDEDHLAACVQPLQDEGRVELVAGERAFDTNLTLVATPGHTPGHVAIGIASGGERAIVIGDASHTAIQLDHPDWSPEADVDPVLSARTRERLFAESEAGGRLVAAGHWPFPGFGGIVRLEGRRVFRAR